MTGEVGTLSLSAQDPSQTLLVYGLPGVSAASSHLARHPNTGVWSAPCSSSVLRIRPLTAVWLLLAPRRVRWDWQAHARPLFIVLHRRLPGVSG